MKKAIMVLLMVFIFVQGCRRDQSKPTATVNQPVQKEVKIPNILARNLEDLERAKEELKKRNEELDTKMAEMKKWAKEHVSAAEKRCAEFKASVYASNMDPEIKDLLWQAVVISSEYCWAVDKRPGRE